MKRLLIITIAISLILAGCGRKPSNVSDGMYESAVYAIKAVDLYLNAESSIEDTKEKLSDILPEYESISEEYEGDSFVWTLIFALETDSLAIKVGTCDISEFKKDRDELAKKINYKE